jgi:RNA polymerase sigma factor (sigma-70 family)
VNSPHKEKQKHASQLVATACRAYDGRLHRFLIHQLETRQSLERADDIAQEVYLRLLRFKDADLVRNPQAYLYQIARNVLADRLEIEGRLRERVVFDSRIVEDSHECREEEGDRDGHPVPSPSAVTADGVSGVTAEDVAAQVERSTELEYILSQLPPTYRAVLVLAKCEGMSYSEIARELQISVHTVKKYVHLALVQCQLIWLEMK